MEMGEWIGKTNGQGDTRGYVSEPPPVNEFGVSLAELGRKAAVALALPVAKEGTKKEAPKKEGQDE